MSIEAALWLEHFVLRGKQKCADFGSETRGVFHIGKMGRVEFDIMRPRDAVGKVVPVAGSGSGVVCSGNHESGDGNRGNGFASVKVANGSAIGDVAIGIYAFEDTFNCGYHLGRVRAVGSGKPALHNSTGD